MAVDLSKAARKSSERNRMGTLVSQKIYLHVTTDLKTETIPRARRRGKVTWNSE